MPSTSTTLDSVSSRACYCGAIDSAMPLADTRMSCHISYTTVAQAQGNCLSSQRDTRSTASYTNDHQRAMPIELHVLQKLHRYKKGARVRTDQGEDEMVGVVLYACVC